MMAVQSVSIIHDSVTKLAAVIASGVTDPVSSRTGTSKFVMTSFPQRDVQYPLITVKHEAGRSSPMGMNTESQEHIEEFRISVFSRDALRMDAIAGSAINAIRTTQFSGTVGLIANNLHDFRVIGGAQFDEPGEMGIHRKDIVISYRFYS